MAKVPVLATIIFGLFAQLSDADPTALSLEIESGLLKNASFGVHSRKRRYLVFPEGSTFTVFISLNCGLGLQQ